MHARSNMHDAKKRKYVRHLVRQQKLKAGDKARGLGQGTIGERIERGGKPVREREGEKKGNYSTNTNYYVTTTNY